MDFTRYIPTFAKICGGLFVVYCVYFDRKRRSDPDFKKKLHERRNPKPDTSKKNYVLKFPNVNNDLQCQKFFSSEIGKAATCFEEKNLEEGFDHVANALAVDDEEKRQCFLLIFQQKYPREFIQAIIERIPEAESRLRNYHNSVQEQDDESEVGTSFPCTTDRQACQLFVTEEIGLANQCGAKGDLEDMAYHYANAIVIVEDSEKKEIFMQLSRCLGADIFSLILQEVGPAEKRLKRKLIQEDRRLALCFLLSIPLLFFYKQS